MGVAPLLIPASTMVSASAQEWRDGAGSSWPPPVPFGPRPYDLAPRRQRSDRWSCCCGVFVYRCFSGFQSAPKPSNACSDSLPASRRLPVWKDLSLPSCRRHWLNRSGHVH